MLSTTMAAERLGVNVRTIQRWVRAGKFAGAFALDPDATRPTYLIPLSAVEAFEQRRLARQPTGENAR